MFDHVQRMPVAFFTRTRTGALVSRLGNDVIGAQRAFSDTLSGVVGNLVTLTLTLAVMLSISWQITVLSLLLTPLFLLPARRIGRTMATLSRESAIYNATMNTQMTERFSAPGATLVKLFGDPARRVARSSRRGPTGSATSACGPSMLQATFMNSLTLMSALALALVYGLGGVLAIGGHLQAGAIVSLALLLTRLYAPLTALANAHVEIASALVSFERVFEVLDLTPLIQEKPDAVAGARRAGRASSSTTCGSPTRRPTRCRWPRSRRSRCSTIAAETKCCTVFRSPREPGQMVALVGSSGAGKSTIASLLARLYDVDSGAVRLAGTDVRDVTFASLKETVGIVTQDGHLFHESIRANLPLAAPDATDDELWEALRRARLGRRRRPTCPTVSTPSSASAATGSPAGSASG